MVRRSFVENGTGVEHLKVFNSNVLFPFPLHTANSLNGSLKKRPFSKCLLDLSTEAARYIGLGRGWREHISNGNSFTLHHM